MPELLDRPVSRIGDADLYAFRAVRLRDGKIVRVVVDGKPQERRAPASCRVWPR